MKLIATGLLKTTFEKGLCEEYELKIKRYVNFESIEIKELKFFDSDKEKYFRETAKMIEQKLPPNINLIGLDKGGKSFDSLEFSNFIKKLIEDKRECVFLIGGSPGIPPQIKEQCNSFISFSKLTFPHKLFRILFLEQIYRAFTILKNEPYHK